MPNPFPREAVRLPRLLGLVALVKGVAEAALVGRIRIVHRLQLGVALDVLERHGLSSGVERADRLPQMALLALGLLVKFLRGDLTCYAIQVLERLGFRRWLGLASKHPAQSHAPILRVRCGRSRGRSAAER